MTPDELYGDPNGIARYYRHFDVESRILLSGHSHQAWPDVALRGQQQAFTDAARFVDDKWQHAFAKADAVRRGYAVLLGAAADEIALADSTHTLLVRLISALPLGERPRIVTTAGEFHTIRRQLARLEEDGLQVVRVAVDPVATLAERLAATVDERTAAAFVSSVLFESARIVPNLRAVQQACDRAGAALVVDAYHQLNVLPMALAEDGLEGAFVTGGGYKYCQLGEGNAFLRVPPGWTHLRPTFTGWFSEFGIVTDNDRAGARAGARAGVEYGDGPARFAGATYDPTSNYRAAEVFTFFREMALAPALLREVSQHQVGLLLHAFDALDLDPGVVARDRDTPLEGVAGFLALRTPHAGALNKALKERGVYTDYRKDILRLGPAPYLSDRQLRDGVAALGDAARSLSRY